MYTMQSVAHICDKATAIILSTSVSLRVVSSKPGVSMSLTERPDSPNVLENSTRLVQDLRPSLTERSESLAKFMNCLI